MVSGSLARYPASVFQPACLSFVVDCEAEKVSTEYAALYCMAGLAHPPRALSLGMSEVPSRQQ